MSRKKWRTTCGAPSVDEPGAETYDEGGPLDYAKGCLGMFLFIAVFIALGVLIGLGLNWCGVKG